LVFNDLRKSASTVLKRFRVVQEQRMAGTGKHFNSRWRQFSKNDIRSLRRRISRQREHDRPIQLP